MSNKPQFAVRIGAQCATDILIHIYDENEGEESDALFAFKLGECLERWTDWEGRCDGVVALSGTDRLIRLRAAAHLERHAKMIRDTLSGPIELTEW